MPIPKSSSIAARATEVYSETWSALLHKCWNIPLSRENDLSDLFQLLPYLRQLLTCCACAGLLENAMISITCGHCYCYECQFRPPLLKIQCRQCRERTGLVIESQLRLIVQSYKHMCCILSEEMTKNQLVLKPVKTKNTESIGATCGLVNGKGGETDARKELEVKESGTDRGKMSVLETGTQIEFQKGKGAVLVDPNFDPILEIIKEVQHGVKVPRAVLIIKPPTKYLNAKIAGTPKKEQPPPQPSSTSSQPQSKESGSGSTKLNLTNKFSNAVQEEDKEREREGEREVEREREKEGEKEEDMEIEVKEKKTEVKTKSSKASTKASTKTTPKTSTTSTPKKRAKKAKSQSGSTRTDVEQNSSVVEKEWTRIENSEAISDGEEIDIVGLSKSTSESQMTVDDLTRAKYLLQDVQPSSAQVTMTCFNQDFLNVTPDKLTLKEQLPVQPQLPKGFSSFFDDLDTSKSLKHNKSSPLSSSTASSSSSNSPSSSKASLSDDLHPFSQLTRFNTTKDGTRKRTWNPLCPRVVVKRSRTLIDKMVLLQSKTMKGKLRSQEKNKQPYIFPLFENDEEDILDGDFSWADDLDFSAFDCFGALDDDTPLDLDNTFNFPPMMPPFSPHPHSPYNLPPLMPPHSPMVPPTPMMFTTPPPHIFSPPIVIPQKPKHPMPMMVGKMNINKPPVCSKHFLLPSGGLVSATSSKKRKSPGYSESGWRCRCGTNSVMFPEKVCAKGKCPCFSKGIPCKNCLCRTCHNPFNEGSNL